MNIWLKELSVDDDMTFCDLLLELASYEDAYARPVPADFSREEFESFKIARVKMSVGENLPSYVMPTTTYWVMDSEEAIGYATVKHRADLTRPGGHLGCCLKRSAQNKGIGTIVANMLSEIAYNNLGITELIYTSKDENIQSQKSLEKIGATLVDVHDGYHYYVVDLKRKFEEGRKI
ncbi:MAG: GNAT family N-acetyltransferase [Firmicutes bacterium]|nr:GNAT family N-acetyltransferase [Bacillota bacterium]